MATIFALSSGNPPAGIGIIRVTGPDAGSALRQLAGAMPRPRYAARTRFRAASGEILDDGLVLWFPGPNSVTGEDLAEFHLHGGRAVIDAVEAELAAMEGLRRAEPGEFTRRAFVNGRIDLTEAEGLGDLLAAETELQRRAALGMVEGRFSARVERWREDVLVLSALVEAALDFDDEDAGAGVLPPQFGEGLARLTQDIEGALAAPSAEMLREGFRVALAGPPNAGKSTLFNALVQSDAAIIAPIAGTTRDVLIRPISLGGVPFSFVDMAGLRDSGADSIEAIGISRAEAEIARADLVLWLGPEGQAGRECWEIEAQIDRPDSQPKNDPHFRISAMTGEGIGALVDALIAEARSNMPKPGEAALSRRQRDHLGDALASLQGARMHVDSLLAAEELRQCRRAFDGLLGRTSTEDVLDAIFGRFCIGK